MSDLVLLVLGGLGALLMAVAGGGYMVKRLKNKNRRVPLKPSQEAELGVTDSEVADVDEQVDETEKRLDEIDEREKELEEDPPSDTQPDPAVVDWLHSREDTE